MYKHILLPTDGSELSEKAIKEGVRLAKSLKARVTGLYVIPKSDVAAGIGKAMLADSESEMGKAAAELFLRSISRRAKQAGVRNQCFYVKGQSPYEKIIKTAKSKRCDLIFMASGRSGLAAMLLGSTTTLVLHNSKIPVLVCR